MPIQREFINILIPMKLLPPSGSINIFSLLITVTRRAAIKATEPCLLLLSAAFFIFSDPIRIFYSVHYWLNIICVVFRFLLYSLSLSLSLNSALYGASSKSLAHTAFIRSIHVSLFCMLL